MNIQIENTTVCNAACAFCVHENMKRPKMHMQQSVFEKTIKDIGRIEPVEMILLTGLGEPLLDPDILDRIGIIKKKFKDNPLAIFTNGTNLRKYFQDFLKLGVDFITVSLNAFSLYDWNWSSLFEAVNGKMKINLSIIVDWGIMDMCDVEMLKKRYPDNIFSHIVGNWTGKLFNLHYKPTRACPRPFFFSHVLVDGRVALCCFDSEGDVILGDNLIDALTGEKLKHYQQAMADGKRYELPLCQNCTTI